MADIFGAAAAAAGLLEGAIRLIQRVRKAYERQKNLAEILDRHTANVESLNAVVRAIVDEDALQTASVASELAKIRAIGARLVKCLKELDPESKGKARQIGHILLRGSQDEAALAEIMEELERAKTSLVLRVQLANVGLTKMVHDTVVADAEVIRRMDRLLIEQFGEGQGLKLAELVGEPNLEGENNLVSLSKADVASLSGDTAQGSEGGDTVDSIVIGNTALDSAVQLLGPVGVNLWENARTRIESNRASGQAVQVASSTDLETLKYLLEHRARTITS